MRKSRFLLLVPTLGVGTLSLRTVAAMAIAVLCVANARCAAQEASLPRERAIYVPFSDLHVILQQQPKRVMLSREEYEDLLKKAKITPETHSPQSALIVSANYDVVAVSQRAEIHATLAIDVLESGLHALPLDLGGIGLQTATLDKHDASLGFDPAGRLVLFVQGIGRHELALDMVAPLETTAARQVLNFRLPHPPAAKLRLTVAGDVEVKGGADVISRAVDVAAKLTRFELLPRQGNMSIVMTLNSHLQRQDRAVIARSVLIDEVTQAYEKLYATVSLGILYRAVDQFRFVVPEGYEITEVTSPLLARWDVRQEGGRKVLGVKLREQTTENVLLKIAAIRMPVRLDAWSAPRLEPLDVVNSVTVFGLLVEDRLKAESLAARGLIPVNAAVLSGVLPANLLRGEPGQAALRAVAAWYAPQSDYALTAQYKKPLAEMAVTTSLLLVVADKGQEVLGGLAFLPQIERRFSFDVAVPDGWQVVSVTAADGKGLPFEHYGDSPHPSPLPKGEGTSGGPHPGPVTKGEGASGGRVRVTVPSGMAMGQEYKANFRAVRIPKGWLADWKSAPVEFPKFAVLDATHDVGAVAVDVRDDLNVRPEKLVQLVPLDAGDKPKYGLAGVSTRLAYRYDSPKYAASLMVERTSPRLTARTFSFIRVEPSALDCHYELIYTIAEARTRKLAFLLPKETPASVSITALDGATIKESNSEIVGQQRRWTVSLAEPARDRVRLAVALQQPLPGDATAGSAAESAASGGRDARAPAAGGQDDDAKASHGRDARATVVLPIIAADGAAVAYQSGVVAVEGCAELEVKVETPARQVDVGELANAEYQPGPRLLGAYGFVGNPPTVKIDVLRHPGYGLYPVIVQECALDTNLSPDGQSQTQARFKLLTKALFLQVKLPAKAELWSAELDGTPLKPQRQNDSLLIDVPAGRTDAAQTLQIVYAVKVDAVASRGTVTVPAPKLLRRAEQKGTAEEVPLVDLVWRLHLPSGYDVVGTGGTVATDELKPPPPAAVEVARFLLGWNSKLSQICVLPTVCSARKSAPRFSDTCEAPEAGMRSYGRANKDFKGLYSPARRPRKDRYSSMDLAEKSADEKKPGEAMPAPYYLSDDVKHNGEATTGMKSPEAAKREFVATVVSPAKPRLGRDLSGTRSLKIDVLQVPLGAEDVLTFRSLGVDPELAVTLANHSRLSALGWGLAMIVGLIGLVITRRPVHTKVTYILAIAVVATIVPLIFGGIEIALLCNMLFYAACWLIPYYVAAGAVRALWRLHWRMWSPTATNVAGAAAKPAAMLLIAIAVGAIGAFAKPQAACAEEQITPITVPEDAVILPYDPDWRNGPKDADHVLVPYDRYVELWNLVHPDKKIETKVPPAPYALAGSSYKTLLEGEEYLLVTGELQIDVFSDDFVQIPLGLGGGVLAQAALDGKPARLSAAADGKPLAVLYVAGKGRHKLDVSVRLKLSRQGGWRVVQGMLPVAAASSLSIVVPKPHTEVRLGEVTDRRKYDTTKADETIRTVSGPGGVVSIQWRPIVAEGQIDRSLTAVSNAVFDVQEDGLRLTWQLGLEFRGGQRERFSVNLPDGYLLEKVEGNNVRGWERGRTTAKPVVEVTLLQPAKDYERFTLRLWRSGPVGQKEMAQFDVPQVTVTDAALHTGQLTIRRSPLLELRTLDRSGVTRTDLPGGQANAAAVPAVAESPLGIQPFEAYTFAAVPFTVRVAAAPVPAHVSAAVQTVLKLAEFERNLESNINLDVQGRRIYQVRMLLPDGLRLDRVLAPGAYEYAVTKQENRSLLTIYLANGQEGNVQVRIRGQLGGEGTMMEVPLPRLEILDVDRQQGDVAVQVDPAFDVEAVNLTNCEPILLGQLASWLNPQQQGAARLGLHYRQGDYSGKLRLTLRKPEVTCDTISNVRVTDRALEETILLNFNIQLAGIRKVSFLLPAAMADSRISVEKLRQKTVEPVSKEAGAPVRVTIELQDEEMGQLHVLVENDRLLTPGSHELPIPTIETGRANRRYAVIENAGRDEVVVEPKKLREMEPLASRQKEWAALRDILGRELTLVYLVAADAREPRLAFHTESHAAVTTVKARIGLSETRLMVDDNGAYRGQVTLWMDNATEQFLEIRLPEGARLWTARVAGEAVKPTILPGAASSRDLRIPLIKTTRGDLYYEVVLKYGGKSSALGTVGSVDFPLVRCQNITPDTSQVRLYVPADQQWFDFGGTMRVAEEADLQANYLRFQTKQAEQNVEALRRGDKWTKIRAETSLKAQQGLMQQYRSSLASEDSNPNLQSELASNVTIDRQVVQELAKQTKATAEGEIQYNRDRLNLAYQSQKTTQARNVVNQLGSNWGDAVIAEPADATRQRLTEQARDKHFNMIVPTDAEKGGVKKGSLALGESVILGGRGMPQGAGNMVVNDGRIYDQQQPSAAQVLRVAPPPSSQPMGGLAPNGQPQDAGYQQGGQDNFSQTVQAQRSDSNAEAYRRYEERRNQQVTQQMGLAGAYTKSMGEQSRFANGKPPGGGAVPPAPLTAVPGGTDWGGAPGRMGGGMGGERLLGPAEVASEPTRMPGAPALRAGEAALPGGAEATPPAQARPASQVATGLASLDFELPNFNRSRWTLYRFTTPRGDEQITGRNVSNDAVLRIVEIVLVAAALVVLWLVIVMVRHGLFHWMMHPAVATLLICFGVISLCGGLAPIVGVIALVAGCGVLVQRWTSPNAKPLAASQQT
jgi:hypothetical protein